MVRGAILVVVASALLAACSDAPPPAPPGIAAPPKQADGPASGVGTVGSKVRIPLPHLASSAYAEIETRAIRGPEKTGGTGRQIDSFCNIWADEGLLVGALGGWTMSGDTARMQSANLLASVKATALDDERVRFEVEAAFR